MVKSKANDEIEDLLWQLRRIGTEHHKLNRDAQEIELRREELNTEAQEITYKIQHLYKAKKNAPSRVQEAIEVEDVVEVQEGINSERVAQAELVVPAVATKTTGLILESQSTPILKSKAIGIRGGSEPQSVKIGDCLLNWWHQPPTREFVEGDRVYITNKVTSKGRIKNQGDRKARITHIPEVWEGQNTDISIITDNGLKTIRAYKFLNELVEIYE